MKYFLDFDSTDFDLFRLKTCEDHDVVYTGRLTEIVENGDDWQDALDRFFEKELNIQRNEWEIG